MRKNVLILVVNLFVIALSAQEYVEFVESESDIPEYQVLASTDTLVEFSATIPGMFETAIDSFNRISIRNHFTMDSTGFPELPVVSFLVAVPECDSIGISIEVLDSVQFQDFNIYPSPKIVEDTTGDGFMFMAEEFAYDTTIYGTDDLYPGYLGEVANRGAIRAQHVARVLLYPVQFIPAEKTIICYPEINVELTFHNASGNIIQDIGIFNEIAGNTIINYKSDGMNSSANCGAGLADPGSWYYVDSLPNQKIDSACDYLIITHDSLYFTEEGQPAIESLAAHRANFNGFDVAIVTISTIYNDIEGDNIVIKLKNFISYTYNYGIANHTYDGKLAYVNLFGDAFFDNGAICVPTFDFNNWLGYDVYFTQVYPDEDDIYPDLMIGRCSVDDTEQVQNVVHKILNFKSNYCTFEVC